MNRNNKVHPTTHLVGPTPAYGTITHDVTKYPNHHQPLHQASATTSSHTNNQNDQQNHCQQIQQQQKQGEGVGKEEQPHPQHNQNVTQEDALKATPRSRLCGVVLIEIPVFFSFLSTSNAMPLMQYYLTERMYEEYGVPNATNGCSGGDGGDGGDSDLSDQIQSRVASYTMVLTFMSTFPAILLVLFSGSMSDRFGRKIILYISTLGTIVRMSVEVLVFYFHWPIEYLYIANVVQGLTGSFGSFLMASYAIVADATRESGSSRGIKIAITEAATMIGASAGMTMSGYWVKDMGFVSPMLFSIGTQVAVLFFILFFIPETVVRAPRHSTTSFCTCSILFRAARIFLERERRCFLLTCLVAFFFGLFTLVGNTSIILLYLLNHPFCWTQDHISLYLGGTMLLSWLAVLSVTSLLSRHAGVKEDTFTLVGALSGMAGFIFQGLARSDLFLYLGAASSLLSNMTWPMLRALMSKRVDATDQGSLFAGIAVTEMLATTVSGVGSSALYKVSLGHVHGLPFFCFAAIDVLVALCAISLIVRRKMRGAHKDHEVQGEQTVLSTAITTAQIIE